MSHLAVIVTDNEILSRSIHGYLECCLGNTIDSIYMIYGQPGLSGDLYRGTDLFILGLFGRDDIGYRAEGLLTAMGRASVGRRVLVVSGRSVADRLKCDWYWDLGAQDPLHKRVARLLTMPPPPASTFETVKHEFASYCRPAVDHHFKPHG